MRILKKKPDHTHIIVGGEDGTDSVRLCDNVIGDYLPIKGDTPVCRACVDRLIEVTDDLKDRLGSIARTIGKPGPAPSLYSR